MGEYLIFSKEYLAIPAQDIPEEPGHIIVCRAPKNDSESQWIVLRTRKAHSASPIEPLGMFWDLEQATLFAESLTAPPPEGE